MCISCKTTYFIAIDKDLLYRIDILRTINFFIQIFINRFKRTFIEGNKEIGDFELKKTSYVIDYLSDT